MNGGSVTIYVGGLYEKNVTTGEEIKYYFANGRRIAMRKGAQVYYLLADHLGSTTRTLDANGSLVSNTSYYPFGSSRSSTGTIQTDRLYTGQQLEASTGLYNYGARWYDPALGRFISPDTIIPNPVSPQTLNRYSYAANNPLRYTDPDGHCGPLCVIGVIALVSALGVGYHDTAPIVNAPVNVNDTVPAEYLEQDRVLVGVTSQDVRSGNWGMVALGGLNYIPGGRYLKEAKALVPGIKALAESRGIQRSISRLTSALDRGAPGSVFQAERTLHYGADVIGIEYRELFEGKVGYLDILLSGNRVVDAKDWTGWAKHSSREQIEMLDKLRDQARKYLSNPDYSLKFEFKESIPEPVENALSQLAKDYGGRMSWEAIP